MYSWDHIIASLTQAGPDSVARVAAHRMQHPRDAGFAQTFGAPYGQRASYRALLTDGRTLCIEDFGGVYEARLEGRVEISPKPVMPEVTAAETVAGLAALGALVGLAFGGKKESVLAGALLGGVSGLATVAVTEANRSPETSRTALELAKAVSAFVPSALAGHVPRPMPSQTHNSRPGRTSRSS